MPTDNAKDAHYEIAWDSCCFLHRLQKTPAYLPILAQITDAAENGRVTIYASMLAIAEVAKPDMGTGKTLTAKQIQQIKDLFKNKFIEVVAVERNVAEMASEFVRTIPGVKPSDAVHVASAVLTQIPVFHTYDGELLKKNGHFGTIRIEKPSLPGGQGSMLANQK